MERATYKPLPMTKMVAGTTVQPPGAYAPKPIRADAPAIEAMTDFRQVPAATIRRNATVHEATQLMIARGVRLLIVVGADRGVDGLVTAHDAMGERAITHLRDRGLKHGELTVADLMTPRAAIDVLDIGAVLRAEVGHVIATLKQAGRQHVLVVDRDPLTREEIVRGVFSLTQIARQLGVPTLSFEVAQTFAEIEAELGK
jgi:CBS domain containing-hemolysin-like protein